MKASRVVMRSIERGKSRYTIVAAPFGIGKTSLAVNLASIYASNYLDVLTNDNNYIPVFIRPKDLSVEGESLITMR
jgi:deoxyadenosine/deoxycytidine kinase